MENTENTETQTDKRIASDQAYIVYLQTKIDELMLKTAVLGKKNKNMTICLLLNLGVEICESCLGEGGHTWLGPDESCGSCKGIGFISILPKIPE